MLNRQLSNSGTPSNGSQPGTFSQPFAYHRSISTPSPGASSQPKSIPLARTNRSKSVFAPNGQYECNLPPSSAPVTFNRYFNVAASNQNNSGQVPAGTSPSSSWYSRLSNSLKKSVLRRSTSTREGSQKRLLGHRRSVNDLFQH